ncbi:hypothetical protein F4809DRAFT_162956 [Biscogniauxia mediterranea]|nr:hypothetical protein F4809DRAFT_162956 [Biscogniauxia mediterranea]
MALALLAGDSPRPCSRSSSAHISGNTGWPALTALKLNRTNPELGLDDLDLFRTDGEEDWKTLDNMAALGLTLENDEEKSRDSTELPRLSLDGDESNVNGDDASPRMARPFHKWMKNLHRRAYRQKDHHADTQAEPFPEFFLGDDHQAAFGHRQSSSGSSYGFVAGVRSASISLASTSVVTRPRRHTARSSLHTRADHSSRGSTSAPRCSEDSTCFDRPVIMDQGVTERLLQRRRILEEIINTEESYIGDIKFLMNVYVTILASLPTVHHGLRSSINRNLTDIVELHEEILGELHRVVPNSEYTQPERISISNPPSSRRHHRWRSLDSVPEEKRGKPWLQDVPSVIAEPTVAAEVSQVFGKRMNRFFVYEEYSAKYEVMMKDVASTHRTLPQWETYQKGLEALAASLGCTNNHLDHSKKSLTIGDLLVKPIQRICRYPLLFAELLKYTPVCDCPSSHMEIENVLIRLREATSEINRAHNDPSMKVKMEQTWTLQDRLVFPNQKLDATSKTTIRSFGQVRLCGALHVCWQTREGVSGQYMVSILYRDCLCLATASKVDQIYTIQACISLDSIRIEDVDNGRGLQCHTAPFSWKLVFEADHQLYEMIMTACSPKEEMEWRAHLLRTSSIETQTWSEPAFYSSISLNIKSLGTVFGKPGTVARRLSIHRATTVGPKSQLCQVILKNTTTMKDPSSNTSTSSINRSQSLLTTNTRIPVLAPSRSERARLEALLADVWSRKILPFPGITSRSRSENLVRSSASTMMRKLSVASITGSFAKRSASSGNMTKLGDGELYPSYGHVDPRSRTNSDSSMFSSAEFDPADEDNNQKLPVIRDESERSSSASTGFLIADGTTISATVRSFDPSQLEAEWCDGKGFGAPALRTTSTNSLQQMRQTPPSGKSTPSSTKKRTAVFRRVEKLNSTQDSLGSPRSPRRWSRVGAINRNFVTSGLRSFFR